MSPFQKYHDRFSTLKEKLLGDDVRVWIENDASSLNNLIMAGMGMGTLFLRMGAVIQMCEKLHDGDSGNDALFMKQMMDNLQETLPSDTNWKNLWYASMTMGSAWEKSIPFDASKSTVLDRFVTFRNRFVHQQISLKQEHASELIKGLEVLGEMSELKVLFDQSGVELEGGKFFWKQGEKTLELHPFVQRGEQDDLPYLFQGLYDNKSKAKFINTLRGNETEPSVNEPLNERFEPIRKALMGGAGHVFDHSERIKYYLGCFVGREREVDAVVQWVQGTSGKQVLPIFSEAGMGKGALSAGIVDRLLADRIPVMYHFCSSGMANSLHAILYHFILQGKSMPGMNGAGVWKVEDEAIQKRMTRLPSRYFDAIKLFQTLLTGCYKAPGKFKDKPLVILIDGLDEAAVSNSQLKISDWFYTYNDKDEPEEDWMSPEHVRWIFTYRSLPDKSKGGFQLGGRFSLEKIDSLQPLAGLSEEAVRAALKPFDVSEEFVNTVLQRGAV
jgi:hypothetical protein